MADTASKSQHSGGQTAKDEEKAEQPDPAPAPLEIQTIKDDDDDDDDEEETDAPPPRETWGNKMGYILTLVGYAVGFGNIWRFPYQVRENGGAVFMIPYCIMLATVGIPTFFLELAVGQRRRKGIVYAWHEISPGFGGLGMCCGWTCLLIGLYYNTLLAYCISYLVDSFRNPLPWEGCSTLKHYGKPKSALECENVLSTKPSKYYWYAETLQASDSLNNWGGYSLWLLLYHGVAWFLVWIILWKGTKLIEKIVWFTALFPYLTLLVFFIANCVIEPQKGWLGATRLLAPDWSKLYLPITWLKAGSQIFFSLGLALGCLVIFASYSTTKNDCHKDAVTISLINCGTSVFAALVVFPMIGALGYRNYEKCFDQMSKVFPVMKNTTKINDHYDIYFAWDAKNVKSWNDVSQKTPITIRYGYGELADGAINNLKSRKDSKRNIISDISDPKMVNIDIMDLVDLKKGCSIGQEATASGGGTGFVFVGFTEAVKQLHGKNVFSFMFFLMLFFLGIDSGFGTVEGAVAAFEDLVHIGRAKSSAIVCAILMAVAFAVFPFGNGLYILDLIDQYTANWTLLVIALMECIAVAWIYGLAKISYDVKLMTGRKPNLYILLCWKYVTPTIIIFLLIGSVSQFTYQAIVSGGIFYTTFTVKDYVKIDGKNYTATSGELSLPLPYHALATGLGLMLFAMAWLPIQACLRKTRFNLIRPEAEADFPEDELRAERNINVEKEADQFTKTEQKIIGKRSLQNLQEYRDKHSSSTSIHKTGGTGLDLKGKRSAISIK